MKLFKLVSVYLGILVAGTMAATAAINVDYYDIIVIGNYGMGKTELTKKLLQINSFPTDDIKDYSDECSVKTYELVGNFDFKLQANERTKIRVFDTHGLNCPNLAKTNGDSYIANSRLLQSICNYVRDRKLEVRRVVYFLPIRGILEKADGNIQEELKLMCTAFGKDVFNCMVIAMTMHLSHQDMGDQFIQETIEKDTAVLKLCFEQAGKKVPEISEVHFIPPVIYLPIEESEEVTVEKIKGAPVHKGDVFFLPKSQQPTEAAGQIKSTVTTDLTSLEQVDLVKTTDRSHQDQLAMDKPVASTTTKTPIPDSGGLEQADKDPLLADKPLTVAELGEYTQVSATPPSQPVEKAASSGDPSRESRRRITWRLKWCTLL